MDAVTQAMDEALTRLQGVRKFDFARAYQEAYSGISVLDPRGGSVAATIAAEMVYGRSLALDVWTKAQTATLALRVAS